MLPAEPHGYLATTDVDLMIQACANGAGIAQILALNVEQLIAGGELIELFPEWPGEIFRFTSPGHLVDCNRLLLQRF